VIGVHCLRLTCVLRLFGEIYVMQKMYVLSCMLAYLVDNWHYNFFLFYLFLRLIVILFLDFI